MFVVWFRGVRFESFIWLLKYPIKYSEKTNINDLGWPFNFLINVFYSFTAFNKSGPMSLTHFSSQVKKNSNFEKPSKLLNLFRALIWVSVNVLFLSP